MGSRRPSFATRRAAPPGDPVIGGEFEPVEVGPRQALPHRNTERPGGRLQPPPRTRHIGNRRLVVSLELSLVARDGAGVTVWASSAVGGDRRSTTTPCLASERASRSSGAARGRQSASGTPRPATGSIGANPACRASAADARALLHYRHRLAGSRVRPGLDIADQIRTAPSSGVSRPRVPGPQRALVALARGRAIDLGGRRGEGPGRARHQPQHCPAKASVTRTRRWNGR